MRGIVKQYPLVRAIDGADFTVEQGEIHSLLGENGAGKSTLMKILYGMTPPTAGEVRVFGKPVAITRPAQAIALGIGMVHQHFQLVDVFTVLDNIILGAETTKLGFLQKKEARKKVEALSEKYGLKVDLDARVENITVGMQQRVEILKMLYRDNEILIFDEPTAVLTPQEIDELMATMKEFAKEGKSILFISHKLKEVMEVCNRYTVLRDGNMVAAGPVAEVTTADLARFMVGHDVRTENLHQDKELGGEILRGEGLGDGAHFRDISFTVHAGEVLGVTGLLGDGRSELFQAVFGDLPYTGQLFVEGRPVKVTSTPQAIRLGIGYVPRNRKENGIIKDMDIVENGSMVTLPRLARRGLIDQRRRDAEFDRQVGELHIKMGKKTDLITSLSGGNQQKVVLAKWLSAHPKVLILDNPTQGVDVGAKEEIYDIILRLAREGVAVVVLSSEAQEIIRVCDRALVLYHGALQGEVSGADMNEQTIMHLATGGAAPSAQAIHTEE